MRCIFILVYMYIVRSKFYPGYGVSRVACIQGILYPGMCALGVVTSGAYLQL